MAEAIEASVENRRLMFAGHKALVQSSNVDDEQRKDRGAEIPGTYKFKSCRSLIIKMRPWWNGIHKRLRIVAPIKCGLRVQVSPGVQ